MNDIAIILISGLFVLLTIGVPFAFSLGIVTIIGLWMADFDQMILVQRLLAGSTVNSLIAIPGFILAGDLMTQGGLSSRLVRIASLLFGHLSGGLSISTVAAGTFFGAISGSAPATTAAVGSMMINELEKQGYNRGYSAALATSIGPLGQLIPPSIPMIIWGVLAEESISKLFLAGVIPGLLAALGFCLVSILYAKKQGIPKQEKAPAKLIFEALKNGFWALMAPVIILGGIYGGIFTPTEASIVGSLYSLLIGLYVYRDLSWKKIPAILISSLKTTTVIMYIIIVAYGFAWVIASEQIPSQISSALLSLTDNPIILLLLINILLLLLGAVMDTVSAMVILSGVLITIGQQIGIDPIQLGAMVVINFAVGMVTPPLGYSLFVASSISGLKIETVVKHLGPFLLVLFTVVLLVAYVPALTLWLPNLIG